MGAALPNDNDDTIKYVVGILDVAEGAIHKQLQQHLQGKEAGEDDVADFQGVGELFGLEGAEREASGSSLGPASYFPSKHGPRERRRKTSNLEG